MWKNPLLFVAYLLFSLSLSAQTKIPPVIEWQKALGGSKIDRSYTVIRTLDNGYLVVGESFSNDGDVTGHHGSTDSSDAWVVKLNAAGAIQWQRSYGGSRNDRFVDVLQAGNGDFICVGSSQSDNGDVSGLHSYVDNGNYIANSDLWAMRINSSGAIIWSKLLGGTDVEDAQVVRKAVGGNGYIISGNAKSVDFDVTGNHGYQDVWVVRINETGSLQWQKSFGNNENQFTTDLIVTSDGNYAISGYSKINGLPTPPPCQVIYATYNEIYIKIDPAGNTIWEYIPNLPCLIPGRSDYSSNLIEMPSGQLFNVGNHINVVTDITPYWKLSRLNTATGGVLSSTNFPPTEPRTRIRTPNPLGPHKNRILPDSTIISCATIYDEQQPSNLDGALSLFKAKTGTSQVDSIFHYRKSYGGTNTEAFSGIEVINEQQFITAGYSNSNNGDVSGNHGDFDCWVVKFSALNQIKGKVFIDNNSNGIKESTELYATNYLVESKKNGLTISSTTDKNGNFLNHVDSGTYTTTIKLQRPYYTVNPVSKQSAFATLNNKDSFDFALIPIPGKNDLQVSVQGLDALRPGFKGHYRISYSNEGTESIANTQIRFVKPPKMDYVSAAPLPSQVNADTIIWNISTLASLDSSFIILTLQTQPLPGVDIGDRLAFAVQIDPVSGDQTPGDNMDTIWQIARGSFDPNDKNENYGGTIYSHQLSSFQSFNYTIRFQNTGTDTAFNIIVRDTLSAKLDPASLQIVAVSHPYTFTLKDNKYCTWTFDNIKLVDSNTNEPLSHGYISYRIKPQTALVIGDTIRNSASIYFDFNPPVRTNRQETIVKPTPVAPPPQPVVSGILNSYCSSQGTQKGKIDNLPAAGSGITVTVKLDSTILSVAADSTFSFDVDTLSEGTHTIQVVFTNSGSSKTTTINFSSSVTVTPEVIISANVTTIINNNPVLITASNAAGGGAAPLFTFASDRNFGTILQVEGSNNIFFLDPAVLVGGDNWIYGRMRTSAACYTAQTTVDSIKLIKILPPVEPTVSGLNTEYCNNLGAQYGKITNLPATGSGISVEVKLDASILAVGADSTFSFIPYALSGGPHTIIVTYTNVVGSKTTTYNFTISSAIMPDVNVTSNITHIVNLINPVIVTAINAAGGGAGPLYAFSKNRDFTALWQAEGNSNTLSIPPSTLTIGDNWIYVRMKSNALCISNDSGVDSIKLTRDMSTGITDPDNPGKVISLYPNPFNKQVFINGLSAGKSYIISITNLNGQLIQQNRISNRSNAELLLQTSKSGTYLLSIYDEKKRIMLGTIKVIKQ